MKSHELAKILLDNPDVNLIIQKDGEGNNYSPLSDIDFNVVYVPSSCTWSGDVYSTRFTAAENCLSDEEWNDIKKNNPGYAVLSPVN